MTERPHPWIALVVGALLLVGLLVSLRLAGSGNRGERESPKRNAQLPGAQVPHLEIADWVEGPRATESSIADSVPSTEPAVPENGRVSVEVRAPDGEPCPGASIVMHRVSEGRTHTPFATGTTDEAGQWTAPQEMEQTADYAVTVLPAEPSPFGRAHRGPIPGSHRHLKIEVRERGAIAGCVVDQLGRGVAGMHLALTTPSQCLDWRGPVATSSVLDCAVCRGDSGVDGAFRFDGLEAGRDYLVHLLPGGGSSAVARMVRADASAVVIKWAVLRNVGVVDENGIPVVGAVLQVTPIGAESLWWNDVESIGNAALWQRHPVVSSVHWTDWEGLAALSEPLDQEFSMKVTPPASRPDLAGRVVALGAGRDEEVVTLHQSVSINGRVAGPPCGRIRVSHRQVHAGTEARGWVWADAAGRFEIRGVQRGSVALLAHCPEESELTAVAHGAGRALYVGDLTGTSSEDGVSVVEAPTDGVVLEPAGSRGSVAVFPEGVCEWGRGVCVAIGSESKRAQLAMNTLDDSGSLDGGALLDEVPRESRRFYFEGLDRNEDYWVVVADEAGTYATDRRVRGDGRVVSLVPAIAMGVTVHLRVPAEFEPADSICDVRSGFGYEIDVTDDGHGVAARASGAWADGARSLKVQVPVDWTLKITAVVRALDGRMAVGRVTTKVQEQVIVDCLEL